jgi:hypothetical protein
MSSLTIVFFNFFPWTIELIDLFNFVLKAIIFLFFNNLTLSRCRSSNRREGLAGFDRLTRNRRLNHSAGHRQIG